MAVPVHVSPVGILLSAIVWGGIIYFVVRIKWKPKK